MNIITTDQHTEQWWAARLGKVTASRIGDLTKRTQKGAWAATRNNYLREKVVERITKINRDRRHVPSLTARLELEPDARAAYEWHTDTAIELIGFVNHPRIVDAGASPDGLVSVDGQIEIKCPDSETHLDIISADAIDRDYYLQIQFGLACTGRAWCDFVSFDPTMPEYLKLYIRRIVRDDVKIREIENQVCEFLTEVDQKVAAIEAKRRGITPLAGILEQSIRLVADAPVIV